MLDHEPDTYDQNPAADGPSANAPQTEAPAAAPRRRRRAATRQAGPPTANAEPPAESTDAGTPTGTTQGEERAAAMAVEAPPADQEMRPDEDGPADEPAAPAKKAARKRTTKTAEAGSRPTRKRASKKAAAAPTAAEEATDSAPVEGAEAAVPDQVPSADTRPDLAAEGGGVTDAQDTVSAAEPTEGDPTEPFASEPVSTPADPEAALDEIRLALAAELPPAEPTEGDSVETVQDGTGDGVVGTDDSGSAGSGTTDEDPTDQDSSDSEATDSDEEDDADEDDESGSPRRRRRRRGGRRRRRGGAGADEARDGSESGGEQSETGEQSGAAPSADGGQQQKSPGESDQGDKVDGADDKGEDGSADDDSGEDSGQRRRRRRRRRRGEDSAPADDDPAEVVVRVREPRSRKQAAQEVTGIEGSTRMEAKRQRRREGREAGRRRAPILSEAEFLARRESVVRKMIVRQRSDLSTGSGETLTQIAVLEDDILVEHYVDRDSAASLIGNVYLGRVQNVLPSMEAAFIDIGRGRNAVLYAGEVDWAAFGANGQQRKVENVLKSGQTVLVQVTKDPVGAKGARLTSHVTLPGRYIVYAPGGHLSGISRKLPDIERKRLKSVLNDLVPESASVIVRTAAEGASEDELVRDVNRLKAQWEDIERKVKAGSAPKLLYGEPDLTVRIVRDLFTEDFAELIIQGNGSATDAYEAVDAYVEHVAPHLHDRLRRWDGESDGDLFATYRLDEQIAKALERKVFLPSGGSLIIDRTEAMTVIDVNTGKFTGSGGNLEATVTSNNLEAAEEIVRQLRLRDIGGIIVIDFIDMVLPSNRELLLRRLVECLGRDRTRHQVAEVTSLGLVQMTRKKIGTGLLEAFTSECEHCHGRGYEIFDMPVETQKQPDGGSRDHRGGGGGGGGRGRGRGNQSNGTAKPAHQPIPAALRPDHKSDVEAADDLGRAAGRRADARAGDRTCQLSGTDESGSAVTRATTDADDSG